MDDAGVGGARHAAGAADGSLGDARPRVGRLGAVGVAYTLARSAGKIAGARIGLRGADVPPRVRQQLGYCLISSSSLAVGLTIQIRTAFPEYAATVTGVVLAAIVIFEIVGPLLTRRALLLTGEAQTIPHPLREVSDPDAVL